MNRTEAMEKMCTASSVVKLTCGICNNAAWLVCLDAMDKLKQHTRWKQRVRGGRTVCGCYKNAIRLFHVYERRLIYSDAPRFFHLGDMPDNVRRQYGNISDREYYDFWASIGGNAYARTKGVISSLWNKYRLSLTEHGIEQADITAWSMAAMSALSTAVMHYEGCIRNIHKGTGLPASMLEQSFKVFSLAPVSKAWEQALDVTEPAANDYELGHTEERNIALGLQQLSEAWISLKTLYGSVEDSINAYDEVFASRGFQKKALQELWGLEKETYKNLNE